MAGSNTYHATVLVLDQTKLGETDAILTLLDSTGRQIKAVAKGGRKPGGKLAGKIRHFSILDGLFARGKNLDILTDAKLNRESFTFQSDMLLLAAASAITAVSTLVAYPETKNTFLWGATVRALSGLQTLGALAGNGNVASLKTALLVTAHTFKILSHEGWQPRGLVQLAQMSPDRLFGGQDAQPMTISGGSTQIVVDMEIPEQSGFVFSPTAGGFFQEFNGISYPDQTKHSAQLVTLISYLLGATYDCIERDLFSLDLAKIFSATTASEIVHISHSWASANLDMRLKSFEYLEKLLI